MVEISTRSGSACVSSMCLFLGLIGTLLVPFLPYSVKEENLLYVMTYMVLLSFGFGTALCGVLNYSRFSLKLGCIISSLAFILWLYLTVPQLMRFSRKFDHEHCLGSKCGESHWLVPRSWESKQFYDKPDNFDDDEYMGDYFDLKKHPPFPDYIISSKKGIDSDREKNPFHPDTIEEDVKFGKIFDHNRKAWTENQENMFRPQKIDFNNNNYQDIESSNENPLFHTQKTHSGKQYLSNKNALLNFSSRVEVENVSSTTTIAPASTLKTELEDWIDLAIQILSQDKGEDRFLNKNETMSKNQLEEAEYRFINNLVKEVIVNDKPEVANYRLPNKTTDKILSTEKPDEGKYRPQNQTADKILTTEELEEAKYRLQNNTTDKILSRDKQEDSKNGSLPDNLYRRGFGPRYVLQHDPRFTGLKDTVFPLNRYTTLGLGALYACLFLCALLMLCYHIENFQCPPKTTTCVITSCNERKKSKSCSRQHCR